MCISSTGLTGIAAVGMVLMLVASVVLGTRCARQGTLCGFVPHDLGGIAAAFIGVSASAVLLVTHCTSGEGAFLIVVSVTGLAPAALVFAQEYAALLALPTIVVGAALVLIGVG